MCIGIYIFNKKTQQKQTRKPKKLHKTRRQKAKETKDEKRMSVENLTGYDDVVCKFALCTLFVAANLS